MNPIPLFLSLLRRVGIDGFMFGIIMMIVLAYVDPSIGITKRGVSLEQVAGFGVSLIFFFYGLRLSPEKLKEGLSNWRMHLVIQTATFIYFPLIVLAFRPLFAGTGAEAFWMGTFFLASLPSTVSSSVVMVSIAGGNIPAAIFNASISSLVGVIATPLWTGLVLSASTGAFNPGDVAIKLALQVILPVALGIALHHRFGAFADKHRKALRYSDQTVILLIIYTSFCKSFAEHIFSGFSPAKIVLLGAAMVALFFFAMASMTATGKFLGFSLIDRITVLFCGSKKSLVHGSVMVKVLFPGSPYIGILLLPLMMYHALQIIIASVIARKISKATGH
ncbi:MAG TPA: bile acid:sodium symporter family protein [Spirochaetota bacterium]|nr:bile acid:sodium symporter family protein [Spirochaetota bacterium]